MTTKAPAFQFYPKEYLSDYKVLRMSWEAQGIYWSLISHIWNDTKTQYSIKNDPESIRAIFKLSKKNFEKVFKQIQWPGDSILKEEDGMLISERLKEEKEKQEETRIKRQEAANKRWGKEGSKSNALALQKECSAFASPTPIASSLKEEPPTPLKLSESFDNFWKAYPKKKSKGQAEKAWNKLKPSEQLVVKILAKIEQAKTSKEWTKDGGEYIPHPATWLNAKGWEDEYAPAKSKLVKNSTTLYQPEKEPEPLKSKNPEAEFIWNRALEEIEKQITQESFDTWFAPTIGYDLEENKLEIGVPNQLFANWLKEHYAKRIQKKVGGREIEFVVVPEAK